MRLYDKSTEVVKDGKKLWFWKLWDIEPCPDIWRVEFQLRRAALKQYGIDCLPDLYEKVGGIWKDLTERWFSLRLPDNESTERRTVHAFWEAVQACAVGFGPATELKRNLGGSGEVSIEWYLSHIDGCLTSVAARLGVENREEALRELAKRLNFRSAGDFNKQVVMKAITLGLAGKEGQK